MKCINVQSARVKVAIGEINLALRKYNIFLKIVTLKLPLFLTIASSYILSKLRPCYAKVFKFHWL